jgi:hypothetical protein
LIITIHYAKYKIAKHEYALIIVDPRKRGRRAGPAKWSEPQSSDILVEKDEKKE